MFQQMLEEIKQDTVSFLCHVKFQSAEEVAPIAPAKTPDLADLQLQHEQAADILHPGESPAPRDERPAGMPKADPVVRADKKVGRNEACPCGSGKKFKHCHGKLS